MRYVFIGPDFEPVIAMLHDVFVCPDVIYANLQVSGNRLFRFIKKVLTKLKWIEPVLYYYLWKKRVRKDEKLVFVYFNPWPCELLKNGTLKNLKKRFALSCHVIMIYDVHAARRMDIKKLKREFDKIYIYDKEESENLGVEYFPPSYSKIHSTPRTEEELYDLCFVGQAKNRYHEAIAIYDRLSEHGLKCRFYILGVDEKEQKKREGIIYGNKLISEEAYFEYVASSKCLLEIMLEGTAALTARVREAVMYDKKILSNNSSLKQYKYYRPDMMQIYSSVDDIDVEFIKAEKHSYNYEDDFSPLLFLDELKHVMNSKFIDE